jgi:threonylcarbamoyladenosine tRNA methylthiotransferase MtaB
MNYERKIAFHTLGCKLNFSETSSIANECIDHGFLKVAFEEIADYYVINTCSVTEKADKECAYIVRQVKRRNPLSKVIIIGCYAQLKPKEISEIEGVDMVLGAAEKFNMMAHLEKLAEAQETIVLDGDIKDVQEFNASFSSGDRTRTFLKIQDGCDYFCTFCTIPLARGRSRSDTIANTLISFQKAVASGAKEIVLTGVNTGDFGKTNDGKMRRDETFFDFIKAVEALQTDVRIRISSIEPNLLSDEIIDFVATSKNFMPHFHIPLQSGSDDILEKMHRKYDSTFYRNKIAKIRATIPNACIGVDVIVGFPEEDDDHFEKTYDFVNSLEVSYLHVFTYSERANTRAIKSENPIPIHVRRERNKRLRILSEKKKRAFYESQKGLKKQVLFEQENDNGFINGYTDNYVRVRLPFNESWVNQIQTIALDHLHPLGYFTQD